MALAMALLLAALVAGYVRLELSEPEPFADRALDALHSTAVQQAIAEQVAVQVIEGGSPQLVASRPLVLTAIEAVLETDEFARVFRRAAVATHGLLLRGDRDVVVELEDAAQILVPAVEAASPQVARRIPRDLNPRIAEIRTSDVATWSVRVADGARLAALPLLVGALAAFALGIVIAPDRLRALATAGIAMTAAAGAGLVAMAGLREQVLSHTEPIGVLSDDEARAAAAATWEVLAGGLETWFVAVAIAGAAIAAGAVLAEARVDHARALRHVADLVAGGSLPHALRWLRGLALAAVGALVLVRAEPVFAAVAGIVGGSLVILGLAEVLSTADRVRDRRPGRASRRRVVAVAAAAFAAVGGAALLLLDSRGDPARPSRESIQACNGLRELCDRRLDQVVFPGTHNSMSAANRPGWFFANQARAIPRQLRDGIRLFMIDPHYGIVDSNGRVRTDLRAEGTDRNRVARRLGPEAVRAAERLAGSLDLLPAEGDRKIFLCHTLCALGAERMSSALDEIRGFLERNQFEVLVVFLESSVDPGEIEREFEKADLVPYLAALSEERPLPTLRQLIESGRRLVVLDEGDGSDASWHHAGFAFVQDTPVSSLLRSATACEPNRGTPESPLLMMNHWIDRFPPPPAENRAAGSKDAIMRRVTACRERRGRVPNLIAVDFYNRGAVIQAARDLNLTGAAVATPRRPPPGSPLP